MIKSCISLKQDESKSLNMFDNINMYYSMVLIDTKNVIDLFYSNQKYSHDSELARVGLQFLLELANMAAIGGQFSEFSSESASSTKKQQYTLIYFAKIMEKIVSG